MYLTAVILLISFAGSYATDPIVKTKIGDIKGNIKHVSIGQQNINIAQYLGIPFAEPPTGKLRFTRPVHKAKFTKVFDASKYGLPCSQIKPEMETSEDCLTLNIHTPHVTETTKYAVMVYIFGGSFISGSSSNFQGHNLAAYGKVVVVTLNYRLGVLGFLSTEDDQAPGNYGLWDQQLAIKWVKDNIDKFGGDTSKITIFGESAGGASVMFQTLYPGNKGMFQGAIAESGTSSASWGIIPAENSFKYAKTLAMKFQCRIPKVGATSQQIMKCLRGVHNTTELVTVAGSSDFKWAPNVDNKFILRQTMMSMTWPPVQQNIFQDINMIIGTNGFDGHYLLITLRKTLLDKMLGAPSIDALRFMFRGFVKDWLKTQIPEEDVLNEAVDAVMYAYTNADNPTDKNYNLKLVNDFVTDTMFYLPARTDLVNHVYMNNKTKTFQYQFNHKYPWTPNGSEWLKGATHGGELPYVFGFPPSLYGYTAAIAKAELPTSKIVMDYWTNFANSGDPNKPKAVPVKWNEYSSDKEDYLYFPITGQPMPMRHLNARRVAFWLEYFPVITKGDHVVEKTIHPVACDTSNFTTGNFISFICISILSVLYNKI